MPRSTPAFLILEIFSACFGLMCLCACNQVVHSDLEGDVVRQMKWLDSADPERDVPAELNRGEKRFLGTYGLPSDAPGVDKATADQYGIRFIDGTGCAIYGREHERLDNLANDYARRYNVLLLRKLNE